MSDSVNHVTGGIELTYANVQFTALVVLAVLFCGCTGTADLENLIEQEGVEAAIQKLRDLGTTAADEYDLSRASLYELGEKYYRSGKQDVALALARFSVEMYPDSVKCHRAAAAVCHMLGMRSEARDHITNAWALDTLNLNTLVQKKRITFVPLDFTPPESLVTEDFRIRPIRPEDAELDYEAIMSSLDHLKGVFGQGQWPSAELTLEENRESLLAHSRQHESREAFCYTVMDQSESECIGCVYLSPSRWDDHDAETVMWVSQSAFDKGLDPVLLSTVQQWLTDAWPFERVVYPGREVSWSEYFKRLDQQDRHRHW
jgi:RimJ/RimL family protein N-acetyltransferase